MLNYWTSHAAGQILREDHGKSFTPFSISILSPHVQGLARRDCGEETCSFDKDISDADYTLLEEGFA